MRLPSVKAIKRIPHAYWDTKIKFQKLLGPLNHADRPLGGPTRYNGCLVQVCEDYIESRPLRIEIGPKSEIRTIEKWTKIIFGINF